MDAIAITYADVLRALVVGPGQRLHQLAIRTNRKASNVRRDMPRLLSAGVVSASAEDLDDALFDIAEPGRRALQALAVADGAPPAAPDGHVWALPGEITHHPTLNPRKRFDPDEIDELRESILEKGLLQSPVVRPLDPEADPEAQANGVRWWIVAGERRLRALQMAVEDGDWPTDRPILCKLREITDAEHRRLALAENLQRVDLDHLELAEIYRAQIDEDGATPQSIATEINKTPEHVQQHLRLLKLDAAAQEQLRTGEITFHAALRLLAQPKAAAPASPPQGDGAIEAARLTDSQALIVGEVFEKVRRDPRASFSAGYTRIGDLPTERDVAALVIEGLLGMQMVGGEHFIRIGSAGLAWVRAQGAAWPDVLWNLRAAVAGGGMARAVEASGRYLTPWLNLPDPVAAPPLPVGETTGGRPADRTPPAAQPIDPDAPLRSPQPAGTAHDYAAEAEGQAALLPPDADEAAEIERRRAVATRREAQLGHLAHMTEGVRRAIDRLAEQTDFVPHWDIADMAVWALFGGDFLGFLARYNELGARGAMTAHGHLCDAFRRAGFDSRAMRARLAKDGPGFVAAHEGLDCSHLEEAEDA